jgi:predicted transcriptional regulator
MPAGGREGTAMTEFDELTWDAAMRRAYAALIVSERLYEEIDAAGGRSNIDIEKHLRRSEVKAIQAQVWLELAREIGREDDRYGHSTT